MTEGFGFVYEEDPECDENTEEDLLYLKVQSMHLSTVVTC